MSPTATATRPGTARGRRGMDPRISARRTAVTREQGRRRLRVVLILLAAVTALVGIWFLLHTPLVSARSITVDGNTHETAAQVVQQSGLAGHPPLLEVNAGAVAARVERLPWVRSASVRVEWPESVTITVTEEVPRLVMSEPGAQWATLSTDGRVLAVAPARPPGLLALAGPQAPGALGSTLGPGDEPGLAVAATLPVSFAAQVTGVAVEPGGWVQLAMNTPIVVDIGTATQLPAKYEDVASLLAGATLHIGDVIDVSVPDAPTVTEG
jgi:cell division protein FtsQ